MAGKLIKILIFAALLSGVVWVALALVRGNARNGDFTDGELYGDYDGRDARGVRSQSL
jgi:hypothetical protein